MRVFDRSNALAGRWKYFAALGLLLTLALVLLLPATPDGPVTWVAVSSQKLEHEIGLVGKIEPVETTIITAPFEGFALANELRPGMQVEQGQALLSLDTALLEIKVRDALANKLKMQQAFEVYEAWATGQQMMRARQALRVAELYAGSLELELSQVEELYQKGIVPRNERDALKQQHNLQSLELTAAKSELKHVQAAGKGEARTIADMEYQNASIAHQQLSALLEHKTLHAPFSGVVLSLGAPQSTAGEAGGAAPGRSFGYRPAAHQAGQLERSQGCYPSGGVGREQICPEPGRSYSRRWLFGAATQWLRQRHQSVGRSG